MNKPLSRSRIMLPAATVWENGLWHYVESKSPIDVAVSTALQLAADDSQLGERLNGFQMEHIERLMRWCYTQGLQAQPALAKEVQA